MSENPNAFKNKIDRAAVKRIGDAVADHAPDFDEQAFVRASVRGLKGMELKARVQHVIACLHRQLGSLAHNGLPVLAAVGREQQKRPTLESFDAWVLNDYVGVHGLAHFAHSMRAIEALTPLFSAEFAIRPFLVEHEARTLSTLHKWATHKNEHVRRLVSEGTRPLLPWGVRLKSFQQDPTETLKLLETLKDDPSVYVRKSVANHINDISKDHPELAVKVCKRWNRRASEERRWVIRHGMRTLIKKGHPGALALMGAKVDVKITTKRFSVTPKSLRLGEDLTLDIEIQSREKADSRLVIDYAIHHVKKSGDRTAKVFKLKTLTLPAGETVRIRKVHKFRQVTTRTYHSGKHAVELLINGKPRSFREFGLRA